MRTNVLLIVAIVVMTSCGKAQQAQEDKVPNMPLLGNVALSDTSGIETRQEEVSPIQIIIKHDLSEKDLYTDYDGGTQLSDYFLIELIDKDTFEKNKSLAISMLLVDSANIKKREGILKLPYTKGEISFVDNLSDGENHKEYTYIGQIRALNVYLVSGIYWEDWNYFLVDKTLGSTVQTFTNMPYLSADEKYIVSIDFDTFEGATFIDLYEVATDKKSVEPLIGMYVKKWIPITTPGSIYWGNDNYLYMPVIHNKDYWAAGGNFYGLDQYIRLKPIAS